MLTLKKFFFKKKMFGTIKRSTSKISFIGLRQYKQFRTYKQSKKNKFDGYWNLILEQVR
jgi:hypothetical protein